MRPKDEVTISCDVTVCSDYACKDCDYYDEYDNICNREKLTPAEKIAALTAALEELGAQTVEKKLFDAMTREAAKYKMLYDALLTACAEQGFCPCASKPPKE